MHTQKVTRLPTAPATREDLDILLDRVPSHAAGIYVFGDFVDAKRMLELGQLRHSEPSPT